MAVDVALMFVAIATAYVLHWASLSAQRNEYRSETVLWYGIEWGCIVLSIVTFARICAVWAARF